MKIKKKTFNFIMPIGNMIDLIGNVDTMHIHCINIIYELQNTKMQ